MTNHVHKTLRKHGLDDEQAWSCQVLATLPRHEFDALLARDDLSFEETIAEAEKVLQRLGLA